MSKSVRLVDIAKRLNVSTVTVSNALSNQRGVSEEMRKKIVQVAEEMGYQLPSAGKNKKTERTWLVGVAISEKYLDEYVSFYWSIYKEISKIATEKGWLTFVEVLKNDSEKNLEPLLFIKEKKTDGVIVLGELSKAYLDFLGKNTPVPLVYLDFYEQKQKADSVISDGFYGMYFLTTYLIQMGHREIGFVGSVLADSSVTDRYYGYAKALRENGIPENPDWMIPDREEDKPLKGGERNLRFPETGLPTAFVCYCDLVASYAVKYFEERGIRVPEDISVVGFDDYLFPGLSEKGITTYRVDKEKLAEAAVRRLGIRMEESLSGKQSRPVLEIVSGCIVEKETVRCLNPPQEDTPAPKDTPAQAGD